MIDLWLIQYVVVHIIFRPQYLYRLYELYCFTELFWVENWSAVCLQISVLSIFNWLFHLKGITCSALIPFVSTEHLNTSFGMSAAFTLDKRLANYGSTSLLAEKATASFRHTTINSRGSCPRSFIHKRDTNLSFRAVEGISGR